MKPLARYFNLVAVVVPFIAVLAAIVLLWDRGVAPVDLVSLVVLYMLAALGITVGYHRLFTHRAFKAARPVEIGLAILGSMGVQGPLIEWVADHRKHHAHPDQDGDPHSPHLGEGSGISGLWHAHLGWLFRTQGQAEWRRYAPEILEDPKLKRVSKSFVPIVLLSLLIPFLIGLAWTGTLIGGLQTFLWAGLVRIFLLHHVTWSINSVCHFFGRRDFAIEDKSTNVFWLALPSLGESWHHNHHAFPRSASHGLARWQIDISAMVITGLEKLGLASNVVRISPERQQAKRPQADPAPAAAREETAAA